MKKIALFLAIVMLVGMCAAQTLFADTDSVTRLEFFTRMADEAKVASALYEGGFADVSEGDAYSDLVAGLANARILDVESASGGKLDVNSPITREEAYSMAAAALRHMKNVLKTPSDLTFADADAVSPWAVGYIELAVACGLIEDGGSLYPQSILSQEEADALFEKLDAVHKSLPFVKGAGIETIQREVIENENIPRPEILGEEYKLVFDDEFDGASLNTDNWTYHYWGSGRTHNHRGYSDEKNVIVKDGILTLLGTNEKHPDSVGKTANFSGRQLSVDYTTGVITTFNRFRFDYGYIEGRFKMPKGKGMWPAFWMLSDGWPPELDIFEILCSNPTKDHINIHYGESWQSEGSHEQVIDTGIDLTEDFHTYGFLWTPTKLQWYFDGKQLGHDYTDKKRIAELRNMYVILNLAIGGWDGDPDATTPWPAEYQCDWVRVWQRNAY